MSHPSLTAHATREQATRACSPGQEVHAYARCGEVVFTAGPPEGFSGGVAVTPDQMRMMDELTSEQVSALRALLETTDEPVQA